MYAIYGNIYHQYSPVLLASIYHTWILWVFDFSRKETRKPRIEVEPQLANLAGRVAFDVLGLDGASHGERPWGILGGSE